MTDIIIRQADIQDLEVVQELSRDLFQYEQGHDPAIDMEWTYGAKGTAYFTEILTGNRGICLIAEHNGVAVGYLAGAMMDNDYSYRPIRRAELENMFVREEYRGRKIGQQLAQIFKEWSKAQGAERIMVSAYAFNERALRFYKSLGWQELSMDLEIEL
jgi:GNAT superfamily N-acetyltransferase